MREIPPVVAVEPEVASKKGSAARTNDYSKAKTTNPANI